MEIIDVIAKSWLIICGFALFLATCKKVDAANEEDYGDESEK